MDTGATCSIISEAVLKNGRENLIPCDKVVIDASGNQLPICGKIAAEIKTDKGSFTEDLLVCKLKNKVEILFGMNILRRATINFPKKEITFEESTEKDMREGGLTLSVVATRMVEPQDSFLGHAIDQMPETMDDSSSEESTEEEAAGTSSEDEETSESENDSELSENDTESDSENDSDENTTEISDNVMEQENRLINVHSLEEINLQGHTETLVPLKVKKKLQDGSTVVFHRGELKDGVVFANTVSVVRDQTIMVNAINLNKKDVVLKEGTKLSTAQYWQENEVRHISEDTTPPSKEKEPPLQELKEEDVNCGDSSMKPKLLRLLKRFRQICWMPGEALGHYTGDALKIELTEDVIINKAPYRIVHAHKEQLDEIIQEMLRTGVISKSKSLFNAPLIIVKKEGNAIRPCLDYRALNKVTKPIAFPMPRISDLLNSIGQTRVISSIDLKSAYHQLDIHPDSRSKTAFTVGQSRYEFNRVPFGLQESVGFFTSVINDVLYDVLGASVIAYMDDILIFSKDNETHMRKIRDVLKKLTEANLKIKLRKCKFFTTEVKFLGYKVTTNGMEMDEGRIKSIQTMPNPENKRQLQAILGAFN